MLVDLKFWKLNKIYWIVDTIWIIISRIQKLYTNFIINTLLFFLYCCHVQSLLAPRHWEEHQMEIWTSKTIVKQWEMEMFHKLDFGENRWVDPEKYSFSLNGSVLSSESHSSCVCLMVWICLDRKEEHEFGREKEAWWRVYFSLNIL